MTTLPLSGDWEQTDGFNANGIAVTPDGRALLVVQSSTQTLFRVNPRTGVARTVDLGGFALVNGDGLLVRGRTLYVVQNRLSEVAVFRLDRDGRAGSLVRCSRYPILTCRPRWPRTGTASTCPTRVSGSRPADR